MSPGTFGATGRVFDIIFNLAPDPAGGASIFSFVIRIFRE